MKMNIVQPSHPDFHYKLEHFSQLVFYGSVFAIHPDYMLISQGLLNPLFSVVAAAVNVSWCSLPGA